MITFLIVKFIDWKGTDELDLGWLWWCVNDDSSKPDYCDECVDAEPVQLEMEM